MNIVDALGQVWNEILRITSLFVIPDWGAIVGLLPFLFFLGIVGPLVTLLPLGILIYQLRKPRVKVRLEEGPQVAAIGADGEPIFPPGLPFCRTHGLVYPSGTARCERGGEALSVICPMCGLGRPAVLDTCTNCGLVLKVKARPMPLGQPSGPKPGGAAAA
ncbi:MAG TPA: hypothetical protein VFI69_10050 [Candidatus Limnocylindrales bacterium]|nr:hypothetical protein [Candidatus Limnocylindrales bacterium]